jgi:hypothetical protein
MAHNKSGNKRKKPSHMRYNAENRRKENKLRRIRANNGAMGEERATQWARENV